MERASVKNQQLATLAAGCFWGVEEAFRSLKGVISTAVGYTGGALKNPTYHDVCTGATGHAEAVQVTFDPSVVSYEQLLQVFWDSHNPTTVNQQGPDHGEQYRSAIFTHTPEQRQLAEKSKEALTASRRFTRPIVTEIMPATTFYRAEDEHQQYLSKRGMRSCHFS